MSCKNNVVFDMSGKLYCSPCGDNLITTQSIDFLWWGRRGLKLPRLHLTHVPRRYDWDGASVPRFMWCFVGSPFDPRTLRASCLHDYLYWTGYNGMISRSEADALLRQIMIADGCSHLRARCYWLGVRLFGWIPWNRYLKMHNRKTK